MSTPQAPYAEPEAHLPEAFAKAFKDADIRGVYPTEIDEVVAYRVARAFVEVFELPRVIVARDMRLSSPSLHAAFIDGVRDAGAEAIDIGLASTPALYFASGSLDAYGVVITASHNPQQYNGLKLVKAGAIPLTGKTGLNEIKKRVVKNRFADPPKRGKLVKKAIYPQYERYVKGRITARTREPVCVAVDAGGGMACLLEPLFDKKLPVAATKLFFELDGTFAHRDSNPTLAKSQRAIKAELECGGHDFGIAFDGDADRVAIFDERGYYINSAVIGALLVEHMVRTQPGASFIHTVFTSKIYEETIRACGGKPVRARVGHAFIKEMMRKRDAVFGCEHSAHFYFKDNFYADSGILTFLYVLEAYIEARKAGKTFSDMVRPYERYFQTEEMLVEVRDKKATLKAVEEHYRAQNPESIERFDGVTVRFAEHWLVVKESVTEDALKFVVESPEKRTALKAQKELRALLRDFE